MTLSSIDDIVSATDELMAKVFPNLQLYSKNYNLLCARPTLAPKNKAVDRINDHLLQSLLDRSHLHRSVDAVLDPEQVFNYPMEFLNSLEPPHRLKLKGGDAYNIWTYQDFVRAPEWW